MSWWEVITDRGRSIRTVEVRFERGELRVAVWGLGPGEKTMALIDHMKKQAHVFDVLSTCRQLAAEHNYELTSKETVEVRIARELCEYEDLEDRFV